MADPEVVRHLIPGAHGTAFEVGAGGLIKVIDVEGGQAVDMFAFCADDPREHLSAGHTRVAVERMFPAVGEAFVTDRRRPILTVVEDNSPGHHDMLVAACDAARYELLGVEGHRNCAENLVSALADLGKPLATGVVPQPVNLFTYIPIGADDTLTYLPGDTQPGDSIVLRAERDIIFAVSSCPQDLTPINHGRPSPVAVEIVY
jgi:hypothetical protein